MNDTHRHDHRDLELGEGPPRMVCPHVAEHEIDDCPTPLELEGEDRRLATIARHLLADPVAGPFDRAAAVEFLTRLRVESGVA